MTAPDTGNDFNTQADQTYAWLRRILDEQIQQTQQLNKIARAAQLYFWLTVIGLLLGICGPLTVFVLALLGVINSLPSIQGF